MNAQFDIDDDLMAAAMRAACASTTSEAIRLGLELLVQRQRQLAALDAVSGIGWEGDLNELRQARLP